MAIMCVCGDPGNGKGIFAMSIIEQACESGRPVYTNITLKEECPYYDRVALIDDPAGKYPVYRGSPAKDGRPASSDYCAFWHYALPGGVVLIDEADLYFDCSEHSAVGADIRLFHKQHRKLGLDLVYIVQSVPNLYVRIRRLVQRTVACEWNYRSGRLLQQLGSLIGRERALGMSRFIRSEFSGCEELGPRTHLTDGYIPYGMARDKYFNWYTTEQLLGDLSHLRWAYESKGGVNGVPGVVGETDSSGASDGARGGDA